MSNQVTLKYGNVMAEYSLVYLKLSAKSIFCKKKAAKNKTVEQFTKHERSVGVICN